jgi:hypothetical protein
VAEFESSTNIHNVNSHSRRDLAINPLPLQSTVTSEVSADIFMLFGSGMDWRAIEMTKENFPGFSTRCSEFGFEMEGLSYWRAQMTGPKEGPGIRAHDNCNTNTKSVVVTGNCYINFIGRDGRVFCMVRFLSKSKKSRSFEITDETTFLGKSHSFATPQKRY